ncbi:MAG: 4-hydroxy-tetrahydrodipicolinate reductase [Lysobacterales bacterium]
MIRVALFGAGKMAEAIAVTASPEVSVQISAIVSRRPPAWNESIPHVPALDKLGQSPEVLIDFSLPDGTAQAAAWCRRHRVPLLSGVTGLSPDTHELLVLTAQEAAVLWSPNLSIGVNVLAHLCGRVAATVGPAAEVRIEDIHHQSKRDAPSGTALMLGETIRRHWPSGLLKIDYQSRREGEAIGEHRIRFTLGGEYIELTHEAIDRSIFARGALAAAAWLVRQPAGLYTAADWLAG